MWKGASRALARRTETVIRDVNGAKRDDDYNRRRGDVAYKQFDILRGIDGESKVPAADTFDLLPHAVESNFT